MTTYNTGNPVPSAHPFDLYDNAENFDNAVNGTSTTWVDRRGVTRPSWKGIEANSAAGSYTVTTLPELQAITPPSGSSPAGRVTEGTGAGYYVYKSGAWVKTVDPMTNFDALTLNRSKDYPMKAVSRGGTAPSDVHPVWNAGLVGARIEGVEADTAYRLAYYGNGNGGNYGVTVYKMPMSDLTAQTLVVTSTASPAFQFDRAAGGIQMRTAIIAESIRLTLVVDVDQLPANGTIVTSVNTTHNGYNSIISPDCYFIKPVLTEDSLSINKNKDFPFLVVSRGGTAPQNINPDFKKVVVGSDVFNARLKYLYRVGYYGNGVSTTIDGVTAKRYGFAIYRIPEGRLAEGYQEIISTFGTGPQFIPDRAKGGIQTFEFACETEPATRIRLSIDVDQLPPDGTQINSTAATHNGFNSIIHPANYQYDKFNEYIEGDCLVDWDAPSGKLIFAYKSNGRWFNERFQRKSINQTFTLLGFGFDAAYAAVLNDILPVDSIALTSRTEASSDFIAPMTFRITSGTPDAGTTAIYTGGSHGTNNTAGDPTSEMKLCNIYVDGVLLDQTKSLRKICKTARIVTQQDVQAWNTVISKRPALEEYITFDLSPKGVHVYKRAKALFDLEFTADNACQVYLAGMTPVTVDSYLFWGGNQTSRRTMTGTTAFNSGVKSAFPNCYGVSVRHSTTNVEFSAWVDPYFGHGDRRALKPTEPLFTADSDNGKIYPRLATPSSSFKIKAGEWYEWRGGYYHGDYTNTSNFDTVIQTQDGVISVKPNGSYVLSESEPSISKASLIRQSNLEKYGVENPIRVLQAGNRSGLLALYYDRTDVDGIIRLTSTGSAGTGYARIDISSENLDPKNLIFRYRIKKVSGSEPNYVLSVSTTNSTSNLYGLQKRISADGLFFTYEIDISRRPDGSPWPAGETVTSIVISLSTMAAGDTSSVYDLDFLSYGYRSETPIRYITEGGFEGAYFAPLQDNVASIGTATRRPTQLYAVTSTIGVSDGREKQQIRELSEAEHAVAVKLKSLIRAFKFNDAVALKGDGARIHFGVIAQDVKAAFESEGLVAEDYAILCHDQWGGDDALLDEEGNVIQEATPVQDRYGVRYEELLAFIISAM